MKKLIDKDATARLRLIPPGKNRLPWFGSSKKYPWIGYPAFSEEMTEEERDVLYALYQEEGLDALQDAVKYLSKSVWTPKRVARGMSTIERGRKLLGGQ